MKNKVKILHLLQSGHFSGAENMVFQIIDMFQGEDVQMAYCSQDGQIREALKNKNITFYPMKKLCMSEVRRVVREFRPDIIHAHDIRASINAAVFSNKVKVISHIHGNHEDMRKVGIKSLLYKIASSKFEKIIWVSNSAFNQYRFKSFVENKSTVLYNIINEEKLYQRLSEDPNTYGYDVIYLGRLSYPKNPIRLINVLKLLISKAPSSKIAIVGDGILLEEAKEHASKLGILENIDFLGFVGNPLKILHDSKTLIMTSIYEGTPMCALEAMALGVPIVSTPTDGLIDLVLDDNNGFLSDDNTVLANKLTSIIEDHNMRNRMSCNAKKVFNSINNLGDYKLNMSRIYFNI